MTEKIYIPIHSFVDVITNSSTEIFMLDTEKSIAVVEEMIKEVEKEYPPEYNNCGYSTGRASVEEAEVWDIKEAFGYYDEEEVVKFLRAMGYTVEKTGERQRFICIKAERGYMNEGLKEFINNTFNVVYYTFDG